VDSYLQQITHVPSNVVLDTFSRAIKQFWPDTHQAMTHADLTGIQSLITDDRVVTSEPQQLLDCKNTTQRWRHLFNSHFPGQLR